MNEIYERSNAQKILQDAIDNELSWAADLDKQVINAMDRILKLRAEATACRAQAKQLQESLDKLKEGA